MGELIWHSISHLVKTGTKFDICAADGQNSVAGPQRTLGHVHTVNSERVVGPAASAGDGEAGQAALVAHNHCTTALGRAWR